MSQNDLSTAVESFFLTAIEMIEDIEKLARLPKLPPVPLMPSKAVKHTRILRTEKAAIQKLEEFDRGILAEHPADLSAGFQDQIRSAFDDQEQDDNEVRQLDDRIREHVLEIVAAMNNISKSSGGREDVIGQALVIADELDVMKAGNLMHAAEIRDRLTALRRIGTIAAMASAAEAPTSAAPIAQQMPSGMLIGDFDALLGIDPQTRAKYMKAAGVPMPGVGKKNHRISPADQVKTIKQILNSPTDRRLRAKCETILETGAKNRIKSETHI